MTTPERFPRGQQGRGRSPRNEGSLFSANPPSFDPQREGISERDIYESNALIQTFETRMAALISRTQKKGLSPLGVFVIGGTGGIVGGAIGAGAVIYVPRAFGAENEQINSFRNTFNPADGPRLVDTRQVNPEGVFDPYAEKGVIKDSDVLRGVSLQTIQEVPMFDENGNPLLLMATPKEGEESRFEKKLVAPGVLPDILEEAKAKNVKDQWTQEVEANTPIPMPIDGYVFLMVVERGGKPQLAGAKVVFMTPNNTLDFINISPDDTRTEALVDAPKVSPENSYGKDYTKGLLLKRGEQNLLRPLVDAKINYLRQGGEGGTLATNRRIPGEVIPLTIKDPLSGEEKLPAQ